MASVKAYGGRSSTAEETPSFDLVTPVTSRHDAVSSYVVSADKKGVLSPPCSILPSKMVPSCSGLASGPFLLGPREGQVPEDVLRYAAAQGSPVEVTPGCCSTLSPNSLLRGSPSRCSPRHDLNVSHPDVAPRSPSCSWGALWSFLWADPSSARRLRSWVVFWLQQHQTH